MQNEENLKINAEMFPNVLGQTNVLNKLRFFIKEQNHSGFWQPILLCGGFGCGKNTVTNAVSKHLKSKDGKAKDIITVNCSSISSLTQFFDDVALPYLLGDKEVICILDEIHALNYVDKIMEALLTVWDSEKIINTYNFRGGNYDFDLSKISFICMTSEPHLLSLPLKSRMQVIQMEELSLFDLSKIVNKQLKDFNISPELLTDIASHGRKNGRECFNLGRIIGQNSKLLNLNNIENIHWQDIKKQLNIRKDGIDNIEYRIMRYLEQHGNCTLTKLAAALNLTMQATRATFESYLLSNGYIEILPQKSRALTYKGKEYLHEVIN